MEEDQSIRKSEGLIVVCFIDPSNPYSQSTASSWHSIKASREILFIEEIKIINLFSDLSRCKQLGIMTTPTTIFYWKGQPLLIERPDWDQDIKFIGALNETGCRILAKMANEAISEKMNGWNRREGIIELDF